MFHCIVGEEIPFYYNGDALSVFPNAVAVAEPKPVDVKSRMTAGGTWEVYEPDHRPLLLPENIPAALKQEFKNAATVAELKACLKKVFFGDFTI